MKTQFPNMFETAASGEKKFEEKRLDHGKDSGALTREDILKMSYAERNKIFTENPAAYEEAMNK